MDALLNEDELDCMEEDDFDWENDWEEEDDESIPHVSNELVNNVNLLNKDQPTIPCVDSSTNISSNKNTNNDSILHRQITVNDKAGLDKMVLDVDHINRVIYEASKNSKFFINEKKRDERIQQQAKKLQSKLSQLKAIWDQSDSGNVLLPSFTQQKHLLSQIDKEVDAMSKSRDLTRCVLHVDMDMFYAAVEIRDNPELKGKPVAVGGTDMLSTSSYEARKFGVKSAMPGFIALQLCPSLIIVKPHYDKYKKVAEIIRTVFRKYDPNFSSFSYDEASLDVTAYIASNPSETIHSVAKKIQDEVFQNTQLTCSVGGAINRRLAKICTDVKKPNGIFVLPADDSEILKFMRVLPIRKAKGIGKVSEKLLNALGIFKCGDIYDNRLFVFQLLSKTWASGLLRIALGVESSMYESSQGRKSMSVERTFKSLSSKEEILSKCQELAFKLEKHLAKENLTAKTLTVKMKTVDFRVFTRSVTVNKFIQTAEEIIEHSLPIVTKEYREHGPLHLRLLGLRVNHFQSDTQEGLEKFFSTSKETSPEKPKSTNFHNTPNQKTTNTSIKQNSLQQNMETSARCPVCNKDLFAIEYSSTLINQHIDDCLKGGSGTKTSPPKKHKTTTIDSFFTKKMK